MARILYYPHALFVIFEILKATDLLLGHSGLLAFGFSGCPSGISGLPFGPSGLPFGTSWLPRPWGLPLGLSWDSRIKNNT